MLYWSYIWLVLEFYLLVRVIVYTHGIIYELQKIVLTLENSYGHISALDDGSVYTIYQNANTGFVFEPISPYIGINTIKSDFEFTFNDKAPSISNFNVLSGDLNNGNISKSNPTFEFDINKSMHVEITANPALTSTVSKTYDTPGTKNIQISGLTNGQYTFTIKCCISIKLQLLSTSTLLNI